MSQRRGAAGRGPASAPAGPPGGGPAANAGVRGALLLAVAVLLGIVLLQKFDSPSTDIGGRIATGASAAKETTTTRRVGLTTVPVVTTTTLKARAKADVKVVVANGAGVKGLGAATTNILKNVGYATLSPADATAQVDKTSIQFAEGYDVEAREVAQTLSLPATTVTKQASPPVAAADIGDAKVIVILGVDAASTTTTTPVTGASSTTSTTRKP